jgi:predicted CopG family antitoxin
MATKTIGIREEVYERLKAQKRDDESFTDTVERLLEEAGTDWREGFGTLSTADAEELERVAERSRRQSTEGLTDRQRDAIREIDAASDDEVA